MAQTMHGQLSSSAGGVAMQLWYLMERMRSPTTMKSPRLCKYRHRMCPWCPHSVCQHQIAAGFVMQLTPHRFH